MQATTSAWNIHSNGEFTPNITPLVHSLPTNNTNGGETHKSQTKHAIKPTMPVITEMENEPAACHRFGMEEGFEKSPMVQLIQEYSSVTIES